MTVRKSRFARMAAVAAAAMLGLTCDQSSTGPRTPIIHLNIVPSFALDGDVPMVPLAQVRFTVSRLPGMTVVLDRVVPFPSGNEALAVDLSVPMLTISDRFHVRIAAIDIRGDTAYTSTVNNVTPAIAGQSAPPVPAPLEYVGADTNIASVTMAPRDTILTVGDSLTLRATAFLAGGTPKPGTLVRFTSRDSTKLAVRNDNRLHALAPSTGTWIVVATSNKKYDSTRVFSVARPTRVVARIEAGADYAFTALGDTATIRPVALDGSGVPFTGISFAFSSTNPAIATVSAAGLVTALATGTTSIIVAAEGRADTVAVAVSQVPVSLALSPLTPTLTALGDSVSLGTTIRDRRNNVIPGLPVTWTTSNAASATVSPAGLVKAVANGSAEIRASHAGLSATTIVTVNQLATSVAVTPASGMLTALGDSTSFSATVKDRNGHTITGASVTWTSSNTAVVAATGNGYAKAVGNGTANMQATSGSVSGTAAVTVQQAAHTLSLSVDTLRLTNAGDTARVVPTARDRNGHVATGITFAYSSSDGSVATVSTAGLVTLVAAGRGTITVTTASLSKTVAVIGGIGVEVGRGYLRITPASHTMPVGDSAAFTAELVSSVGTQVVVPVWSTDVPARLGISSAGRAAAHATGTAVVTATYSGLAAHSTVSITPAPRLTGFSFSPRQLTGVSGSTVTFSVTVEAADAGSGISAVAVTFTGPDASTRSCTATAPIWGTPNAGGWTCAISIPAGSAAGIWRATTVSLTGTITRNYGEPALSAFGATTLEVRP
jgi:trimeric autotransporter adhesin